MNADDKKKIKYLQDDLEKEMGDKNRLKRDIENLDNEIDKLNEDL